MKSGKRYLTDGMELPNQSKIRTLGEKETYRYLSILEADIIKKVKMKGKIKNELQQLGNKNGKKNNSMCVLND